MSWRWWLLLVCATAAPGKIIDRLAVAVGSQVITEMQLDEELRVVAMLNHKQTGRSLDERREAADRMVEQLLIKLEMEMSRYPLPAVGDVDKYLQQIIDANGGPDAFEKALQEARLTVETVRRHLELQLTELRFIDYRFRPDATISDGELEAAYRRQAAEWKRAHTGEPPTLEASREPLRAMLVEERTDAALNTWLAESRKRVPLIYFDSTLE